MKANGTDAGKKLANANNGAKPTLKQWVIQMSDQLRNALPANITPERMSRIALTALSKDSKLAESTPQSFMGALLTSAQLGLECNTPLGQAYLIPFWNKKAGYIETQFQIGYQGTIDLCYRTGQYKKIIARIVYEGDEFDYSYGLEEKLMHRPHEKTDKPIYVYALYELCNGASAFEVMSWEAVQRHAKKYSQSVKSGFSSPWTTDPESMAKKTVLKKVLKYAPKTVEVAEAVNSDSAVINAKIIQDGNDFTFTKDIEFVENEESKVNALPQNEQQESPNNSETEATSESQTNSNNNESLF